MPVALFDKDTGGFLGADWTEKDPAKIALRLGVTNWESRELSARELHALLRTLTQAPTRRRRVKLAHLVKATLREINHLRSLHDLKPLTLRDFLKEQEA
jgi:hypothetical protein